MTVTAEPLMAEAGAEMTIFEAGEGLTHALHVPEASEPLEAVRTRFPAVMGTRFVNVATPLTILAVSVEPVEKLPPETLMVTVPVLRATSLLPLES